MYIRGGPRRGIARGTESRDAISDPEVNIVAYKIQMKITVRVAIIEICENFVTYHDRTRKQVLNFLVRNSG